MKLKSGFSSLIVTMMLLIALTIPATACEPGTPCSKYKENAEYTELKGIEKSEDIAYALNLKDVQKLGGEISAKKVRQLEDSSKVYSLKHENDNGTVQYSTAVILPVEIKSDNETFAEISNVVAVWTDKSTKVMRTTHIYENSTLKTLSFSRVGNNGEIVSQAIISNGKIVADKEGDFFTKSVEYEDEWECVAGEIIGDCLCAVAGVPCPPGLPSLCDICIASLTPCYIAPNPLSCTPAALCMTLELVLVLLECEEYA